MRSGLSRAVLDISFVRSQHTELNVSARHSRQLRQKYGPAWRYIAPIPSDAGISELAPLVPSTVCSTPPAQLDELVSKSIGEVEKSGGALKPVSAMVISTLRMCFHLLIRNRFVEAAVSMYHRLMDLGYQMQRSDLSVLLWNLPYDKSTTVSRSEASEWTSAPAPSWKDRRKATGTTASEEGAKRRTVGSVEDPCATGNGPCAAVGTETLVAESERPAWLKRWIEVEVAMGNIDLYDAQRFSKRQALCRPFREPTADDASHALDQQDAALANAAHRGICAAEFAEYGIMEPLPLIEHLTFLQNTNTLQKVATGSSKSKLANLPAKVSYWSEALHLASMYCLSQPNIASPRLLQACADAAIQSTSWKVQHSYLSACALHLTPPLMRADSLLTEVSTRMLINVLAARRGQAISDGALRSMGLQCSSSECVRNAFAIVRGLSKIESNGKTRRRINLRQLLSDCIAAAKVATSHLFIDVSRFVEDEKRKSAVAVSISRGLYTAANTRSAQTAEAEGVVYSHRCLVATHEMVCVLAERLAKLLPSIGLLATIEGASENSGADDFVRDIFFSTFGLVESLRLLSTCSSAGPCANLSLRLSAALGAMTKESLAARRTSLSLSTLLQVVSHLRLLSASGVKSSEVVVVAGCRCATVGSAAARHLSRVVSEVGKKLVCESLALVQQSGHWISLDFRHRAAIRTLWADQLGRQIRDSLSATEARRIDAMIASAPARRCSRPRLNGRGDRLRVHTADVVLSPARVEMLLSRCTELSEIRSALASPAFLSTLQSELDGAPWDKALRIVTYLVHNARIRPRTLPPSIFSLSLRALKNSPRDMWLDAVQVFWVATDLAELPKTPPGRALRPEHLMLDALLAPLVKALFASRHASEARGIIRVWEKVCAERAEGIDRRRQFLAFAALGATEALMLGVKLREAGVVPDGQVSEEFQRVAVSVARGHWTFALEMLARFVGNAKPSAGNVRAALRILRECPSNLDKQALALYQARESTSWNSSCTFHLMSILNRKKSGWSKALEVAADQVPVDTVFTADDSFGQQVLLQGLRACAIGGQVEPATTLYDMWKRSVTSTPNPERFAQQNEVAKCYFFRAMTKPLTAKIKRKTTVTPPKVHSHEEDDGAPS
jgi:hypothetical protein